MSFAYPSDLPYLQPAMESGFPLEPVYTRDHRFSKHFTGNMNDNAYYECSSPVDSHMGRRRRVVSAPVGSYNLEQSQYWRKASHRRTASDPPVTKNSNFVRPDVIDRLDNSGLLHFHHEGPYDAVKPERNLITESSPIAAVQSTNSKALEATAPEKIVDSINNHMPLDGTAFYPPGTTDDFGHTYDYEEGPNMMNDYGTNSGNFARCPGQVGRHPSITCLELG